jgi:predicted nucleic acid-binding protein
VDAFIAWVRSFSTIAFVVPKHMSYPRDPDDEPYLNLAIAAQASYIVSRDNDLLNLMQSQDEVSLFFRKQFPNIRILDAVSFIEVISKQQQSNQPVE